MKLWQDKLEYVSSHRNNGKLLIVWLKLQQYTHAYATLSQIVNYITSVHHGHKTPIYKQ